jgi:hypothetical protein
MPILTSQIADSKPGTEIALAQTLEQFTTGLGFDDGEPIYLRLLPPKNFDPGNPVHQAEFPACWYVDKKTGDKRKSSRRMVFRGGKLFTANKTGESWASGDPVGYLEKQNQRGFCPYVVVNPGGHNAASITGARVIFWESDDKSKSEQLEQFRQYAAEWGGGMAVETKSSIHSYIRLDRLLDAADIQPTQLRLIELMGSDRSIQDPNRLMRLPGFDHVGMVAGDDGAWVAERFPINLIHPWDGTFASWAVIDAALPKPSVEAISEVADRNATSAKFDQWRRENPGEDKTDELALDALNCIPRRVPNTGTYGAYRNMLWGLKSHFGEIEAVRLMDAHSPSSECGWDVAQVARSGGDHVTLGSLFHYAKEYGFKFPEKTPKTRKEKTPKTRKSGTPRTGSLGVPASESHIRKVCQKTLLSDGGCLWKIKITESGAEQEQVSNFDIEIDRVLTRTASNPGGLFVSVTYTGCHGLTTASVLLKLEATTTRDKFLDALKLATGANLFCTAKIDAINFLIDDRTKLYYAAGGRDYRLIDRVGRQEDGFWVFENCQFTPQGLPCTEDESGWLWNQLLGDLEQIPSPKIAPPNPAALGRLVGAFAAFAPSESLPYFLLNCGIVASILHRAEIHAVEGFFPQTNLYGDPGGIKTASANAACAIAGMHGTYITSVSESVAYERAKSLSCLPLFFDDPLKKADPKAVEIFDDLLWKLYNGASRIVRGNCQSPHTAAIVTTNQALGENNVATESRLLKIFTPKFGKVDKSAVPALSAANIAASGGLGDLIALGYPREEVCALRDRLLPHLENSHERIADSMAIVCHYTQEFCNLAGVAFDAFQFCVTTLCPAANDTGTQKDSLTDFLEKIGQLRAAGKVGDWNFTTTENRDGVESLAIWLPDVWDIFAKTYQVNYSRQTISRLVEQRGGQAGKVAKFVESKMLCEQYQKSAAESEINGGAASPARPAKMSARKALLVPIALWEAIDSPDDGEQHDAPPQISTDSTAMPRTAAAHDDTWDDPVLRQERSARAWADADSPPVMDKRPLQVGDRVRYIGSHPIRLQYAALPLEVKMIRAGGACCEKPDGGFTSDLPLEELEVA